MSSFRCRLRAVAVAAAGLVLSLAAACTTSGDVSSPVARKLTWFSHLNGDDIRAQCRPGAPDRLRLVHNADYNERVRLVDAVARPDGGLALTTRILEPVALNDGIVVGRPSDLLAPWAGTVTRAMLAPQAAGRLRTVLARDGLGGPPPAGSQLRSWRFWWVAVACLDGAVRFQAWARPNRGYETLTFPAELAELDGTGTPIRRPSGPASDGDPVIPDREAARHEVRFRLAVGPTGLNP